MKFSFDADSVARPSALAEWMRAQHTVAYACAEDGWQSMFIDYPEPGPEPGPGFGWVGQWALESSVQEDAPDVVIAAAPQAHLRDLVRRLGLTDPDGWETVSGGVLFCGIQGRQDLRIRRTPSGDHAALAVDGSAAMVAVARSERIALDGREIVLVTDPTPLIHTWLAAVVQGVTHSRLNTD